VAHFPFKETWRLAEIVVIGIGQPLRGDDQAGLEAVKTWQEIYSTQDLPFAVRVELAESPGLELLDLLKGAQAAILVDAVQSGSIPGTLHVLADRELVAFTTGAASAHGWGVIETLKLGRLVNPEDLPGSILLIGIEAAQFEPGREVSPEVQNAMLEAAALINFHIELLAQ
jgi:hydrogenase maturation protease